jgi:hypothetical protein
VDFDPGRYSQRTLEECMTAYSNNPTEELHCWVHVSVFHLVEELPSPNDFTYQLLLEVLVESEYRSAATDYNPSIFDWANEAVARQFYDACALDGCQGDELYTFLDYFQAPGADQLRQYYRNVIELKSQVSNPANTYWIDRLTALENAVMAILMPPDPAWHYGVEANQPIGYATAIGVSTDAATIANYQQTCGFAVATVSAGEPPIGNIFFGTTPETDAAYGGDCHF